MKKIQVQWIVFREECRISLRFERDMQMNERIKLIPGVRFSKTMRCWHMPCDQRVYNLFRDNLLSGWVLIENNPASAAGIVKLHINIKSENTSELEEKPIRNENREEMVRMVRELEIRSYSVHTIRTYRNEFGIFLQFIKHRDVTTITVEELKRYMQHCATVIKLSENTMHSRLNALKFYFEQVLNRPKFFFEIKRPRKPMILPKVLGERELGCLFAALLNRKHKAILFTAYSAGLRVSEVVNLRLKDVDSDRMQLFIKCSKGKKDRYVMLSPVLLDILRVYLKNCEPRPKLYLFEGEVPGRQISIRTAQQVFQHAKQIAGIKKEVSFHCLRHSFATHLLEKGVDIRYIKELLGHNSINTTERYLHVKRERVVNIASPIDDLFRNGGALDF